MSTNPHHAMLDDQEMADLAPMMKRLGYLVHIAKMVDADGNVSPLCAGDSPRAVDLKARESWVYSPRYYDCVTCESCRAAAGVATL